MQNVLYVTIQLLGEKYCSYVLDLAVVSTEA